MRDLPTEERYAALLNGLPPDVRMDFDMVAMDIASNEIDVTDSQQWRALADTFASRGAALSREEHAVALMIAACMMDNATRLRDGTATH